MITATIKNGLIRASSHFPVEFEPLPLKTKYRDRTNFEEEQLKYRQESERLRIGYHSYQVKYVMNDLDATTTGTTSNYYPF